MRYSIAIEVSNDNAAYENDRDNKILSDDVARAVWYALDADLMHQDGRAIVTDSNGNTVGAVIITESED